MQIQHLLFLDIKLNFDRLHTLSAQELYDAHLTPYLQEATQMLELRLRTSQQDNQALMEKIATQRAEIERLVGGIEGVVKDLESSVEVMGSGMGGGVDGLRAEVWEMEEEVKAASETDTPVREEMQS
jgi:kinetochore protein NNF1